MTDEIPELTKRIDSRVTIAQIVHGLRLDSIDWNKLESDANVLGFEAKVGHTVVLFRKNEKEMIPVTISHSSENDWVEKNIEIWVRGPAKAEQEAEALVKAIKKSFEEMKK